MLMELTLGLGSSSCRPVYPHRHVIAPLSVVARSNLVSFQRRSADFSVSSASSSLVEVVDGKDCLPNSNTPWLKLCPEIDRNTGGVVDLFYSPVENRVVRLNREDCLGVPDTAMCFASAGEWLGFVDRRDDCPVYLTNPFLSDKDRSAIRLPSLATIPSVFSVERDPKTGRVTQFNVLDTTKLEDELNIDPCRPCKADSMAPMIHHLALSHSDPCHVDCVATALQFEIPRLAYARVWDDPKTSLGWIGLQEDYHPGNIYNQVVFSDTSKLFYTINKRGIEVLDLLRDRKRLSKNVLHFKFKDIERELECYFEDEENEELINLRKTCRRTYHLASFDDSESRDDNKSHVVLIVRHMLEDQVEGEPKAKAPLKTLHFDVFKVHFRMRFLIRLTSLEERCIFVGSDQSFSLCASKYPGLCPNSIYFIDSHLSYHGGYAWHNDRGIFDLARNTIEPISCPYAPTHPLPQGVGDETDTSCSWKKYEKLFWVSPSRQNQE